MFQRVAPVLAITAIFLTAADGPKSQDLTIHEWGTFTSVAGADGSAIPWNSLACPDDLPRFVNSFGIGFKATWFGTVRMETPVMYFYSPRELTARVAVQFPHGFITEWYPKAEVSVEQDGARLPPNLSGIDLSMRKSAGVIEWRDIKVQPGAMPKYPVEDKASRYYPARETDATPISVDGQAEKFLFYRGVGRLQVPLSARVLNDGKTLIESQEALPGVILFENRGGKLGYRKVTGETAIDPPVLDSTFPRLQKDLETMLVEQGLFAKEAHAMVETWRTSWFEEGSRLLYIVPPSATGAMLPVQIEPAPQKIVRVFVGRIELITPATTNAVKQAIGARDAATLNLYGRFIDPILSRIGGPRPNLGQVPGFARCQN
jgi:hypothetical protein